jgi:[ribosomal protein S18]-alanine N-acetyltransferase
MTTRWRDSRAAARFDSAAGHGGPGGSGGRPGADGPSSGPGARLRRLVPADLADVLAMEHDLFPDDPWTARMFAEEVDQPPESRLYLVAEAPSLPPAAEGRVMAGYAGLMFVPGGVQADVLTIAVARAYWGRGIGSALLGALLDAATARGCAEVFLEVRKDNPRARGLYLRRGFEEIGVRRGYYQPSGVDAIVMRKDLLR